MAEIQNQSAPSAMSTGSDKSKGSKGKGVWAVIVLLVIVIAVGAYYYQQRGSDENMMEDDGAMMEGETMMKKEVTVALSPLDDSGESGTGIITDVDGQAFVSLSLSGTPEGVAQPAHIHLGACADLGGVKYPLTSVVNGESETSIPEILTDTILAGLPLAINVHQSTEQIQVYVACGDIEPLSDSAMMEGDESMVGGDVAVGDEAMMEDDDTTTE